MPDLFPHVPFVGRVAVGTSPVLVKVPVFLMINVSKEQSTFITSSIMFFILLVFWITLAPTQLGGPLTYVIVNGNSMEPGFLFGDLVLVRAEPVYAVGDAIVYKDPNIRQFVFHRIVGLKLDHFITQGDNNNWQDTHQPTHGEVVGKLWVHIPKLGKAIEWFRMPMNAAVTTGLFGALLMLDMFKNTPQTKRRGGVPSIQFGEHSQGLFWGSGLMAVFFLALGIYSFIHPLNQPMESIPYEQTGDYYYSATGTPGVYDLDVVRSGEPVFPKLTCFLNVGFNYNIGGGRLQGIVGSHKMYARILDEQSGWQRTIPLYNDMAFSGTSYFSTATLDLCQVEAIVNLVEAEAGLKQIAYTLEIITEASFVANAEGNPVQDSFSQALVFQYDKIHFYLSEIPSQPDPLHFSKPGAVGSSIPRLNTLSLFGLSVPVWTLRFIAVFGFAVSGLITFGVGVGLYQTASQSEEALTRLKYSAMIVNIHDQTLPPAAAVVDVENMDDLARLAERNNTMILHMRRNFLHFYFVQSHGITYRYVITTGRQGVATVDELATKTERAVVENVGVPVVVPISRNSQTFEDQPIRVRNRLIYTYPPQKEIWGLDEIQPESEPRSERTWTGSKPPEYVTDASQVFDEAQLDTTMMHKLKI
ncbi:MAG: signal peptidase I [Anaerolineales bacterium]|nr:signal peptidase I [Anaerolineales bacterium]MCB9145060.1 signal peptidase I [Anaerolineales bacterium]